MSGPSIVVDARSDGVVVSVGERSWVAPDLDVVDLGVYLARFGPADSVVLRGVLDGLRRPDLAVRSVIETIPVGGRLIVEPPASPTGPIRVDVDILERLAAELEIDSEVIDGGVVLSRDRSGPVPVPRLFGDDDRLVWPPRPDGRAETHTKPGDVVVASPAVPDLTEGLDELVDRDEVLGVEAELATLRARLDELADRVDGAESTADDAIETVRRNERYLDAVTAGFGATSPSPTALSADEISEMQATLDRRSVRYVLQLTKWLRGS